MKVLDQAFEFIIIDAPPSAVVADAAVYAKCADAALYIVRQDYARFNDIIDGIDLLADTRVPLIGCVLNDAVAGFSRNYGYGYGYGAKHSSKGKAKNRMPFKQRAWLFLDDLIHRRRRNPYNYYSEDE